MKTKLLALSFISVVMGCSAQQIQTRSVTAFDKIQASGSVDIIYTTSDTLSLSVKAKDNEIKNVETKVVNSTLIIDNKGRFKEPVIIYIKNNQFVQLEIKGAVDFKTTNALKTDSLILNISGASDVHADLDVKRLKIIQTEASEVELKGTTDRMTIEISGATTLNAYDLTSKAAIVVASGAALAKVYVSEKVTAIASGASDIKIKGDATDISADATSAATIVRVSDQNKNSGQSGGDSTFYHFKHKKIIIIHDRSDRDDKTGAYPNLNHFKHWTGFAVGINGYMNSGAVQLPAKDNYMDVDYRRSFNFQLNLFEHQFNIIRNNFKIITGIGFDFHLYEFANKTTLNPDSSYTSGTIDSSNKFSYKKDKLRNTYIQVPLLFEFNTSNNPYKTFHIAVGVIGQFLIASRTKQVLEQDDNVLKKIRKDSYNMSPFAAKVHLNMGYKGWTVFAEYNLTKLFQSGKGPELYPFTVGLRVIPFA